MQHLWEFFAGAWPSPAPFSIQYILCHFVLSGHPAATTSCHPTPLSCGPLSCCPQVVFATETLAAGINMPARTTLMAQLSRRRDGGIVTLQHNELLQMAGGSRGQGLSRGQAWKALGWWSLSTDKDEADPRHDSMTSGPPPTQSCCGLQGVRGGGAMTARAAACWCRGPGRTRTWPGTSCASEAAFFLAFPAGTVCPLALFCFTGNWAALLNPGLRLLLLPLLLLTASTPTPAPAPPPPAWRAQRPRAAALPVLHRLR